MTSLPFDGKVAMVTGASAGIGEAIALMLAARGASVALCGRNEQALKNAVGKILAQQTGDRLDKYITIGGDVTSRSDRQYAVDITVETLGGIDILIHSAGIALPGSGVDTCTEETYDRVMDTNLKAVLFLTQAAQPHLEKSRGCVVTVSSVYSIAPGLNQAIYAVSKAGLDHLTRCMALTYGPKGIRVNSVNPSYVATDILRSFPLQRSVAEAAIVLGEREASKHPLEGRCATVEEVAEAALFLASSSASFITGQNLLVDGGRHFLQS